MKKRTQYNTRRTSGQSDKIKGILVAALKSTDERLRFNELFERAAADLQKVYASQGEEFLRLRSYELLQELVATERVLKDGRLYYALKEEEDADESSKSE